MKRQAAFSDLRASTAERRGWMSPTPCSSARITAPSARSPITFSSAATLRAIVRASSSIRLVVIGGTTVDMGPKDTNTAIFVSSSSLRGAPYVGNDNEQIQRVSGGQGVASPNGIATLIYLDASAGKILFGLSTASTTTGRSLKIKRVDGSAFDCRVQAGGGQPIDDQPFIMLTHNEVIEVTADLTGYKITQRYRP